jgi:hypothetical protein
MAEEEQDAMEREERGDERKKKIGVFWSINFNKHIEGVKGVSSSVFLRIVKL